MKSASTLRESSLANSWFSKNSSSSVRIPTLYLRSEKSNIYSYFNLFKMKITVGFGCPSFSKDWYIKESSSLLGIPSIHNTMIMIIYITEFFGKFIYIKAKNLKS